MEGWCADCQLYWHGEHTCYPKYKVPDEMDEESIDALLGAIAGGDTIHIRRKVNEIIRYLKQEEKRRGVK